MLFCYELNSNKFDLKTQFHCTIHGVPLLATFAAFFFARRPRGTPAGAAETHAPAAPASARLWAAALRGCAAQPRVLLRPSRPRPSAQRLVLRAPMPQGAVPGCDVHVRHSCAGAQAARSHVHESLRLSFLSLLSERLASIICQKTINVPLICQKTIIQFMFTHFINLKMPAVQNAPPLYFDAADSNSGLRFH